MFCKRHLAIASLLLFISIYVIFTTFLFDMATILLSRSFRSTNTPFSDTVSATDIYTHGHVRATDIPGSLRRTSLPAKKNITYEKPDIRNITCRKQKFANPHLPITALASVPGSGNTWFRHLLQKATGIYTGSIYNDGDLAKHGFPGEGRINGSVIAVKLHSPCQQPLTDPYCLKKMDRAILLVRDARGAGKAEFNRQHTNQHVGQARADLLLKDLPGFLERSLSGWNETNIAWLSIKKPLLMVDYDQLKLDPKKEMSKVFDFLKFPVSKDDLECMLRDSEGKFHRKANQAMPKLSAEYIKKVEQAKELMKTRYKQRQIYFRTV